MAEDSDFIIEPPKAGPADEGPVGAVPRPSVPADERGPLPADLAAPQAFPGGPGPGGPIPAGRAKRRLLVAVAAVLCVGLAVAGGWWWLRASNSGDLHVAAGTVQADLLVPDEVSRLAGTTLVAGPRGSEPPEAVAVEPSGCAVAAGPATRSVYGNEWTAFLSATYQDPAGTGDHTVTQVVGVYPDEDKASAAFRRLDEGLRGCPSAVRTDPDGSTSGWTYKTDTVTPDTVGWTATQDSGDGWGCHRQARLKGRMLLQVALCSAGDGRPAVARIADRIAEKVTT
ncbi:hypothetical protein P3T27_005928 [Kitasatospora sp. MAA19]|uniref:sensor domain-containing protein n=1 Tax=unclassified Kitasatospora TaxID=2633591 RepID=UPI002473FB5D|nr:sensor domain-containing protein [Kitasatospora sp. MAA19]MDH6709182.1 hypothetical protein [Kitasatospora sp. MAA19]